MYVNITGSKNNKDVYIKKQRRVSGFCVPSGGIPLWYCRKWWKESR